MPTNKHAAFRYRAIDHCLTNKNKRRWKLKELLQAVSGHMQSEFGMSYTVGQRTLQGDIKVMRLPRPVGFGAPIVCRLGLYYYADPEFSIEKSPLRPEELALLDEGLSLISQLPALPQAPLLESLLHKLGARGGSPSVIQFEINLLVRGLEWLSPLHKAINNRQTLNIQYHPFNEPSMEILLHPYLLKEWRNRWYVFGRNHEHRLWNLALDRIEDVRVAEEAPYLENDLFDPLRWFDDIVGVSKPEGVEPVEILLETSLPASYYLETKPLHASQRLLEREGEWARFSLRVIPNHELVGDILFYGKEVRVVAPEAVAAMVRARRGA
jgi:predicted DNA-binding transcriptional regulator YafY